MAADAAAASWATVMQKWPGARLVSPATAGNGVPWLTDFFAACKSRYGASGCRLDAVAVHDYSCDPVTTMGYLDTIFKTFGLPVWLTEVRVGPSHAVACLQLAYCGAGAHWAVAHLLSRAPSVTPLPPPAVLLRRRR